MKPNKSWLTFVLALFLFQPETISAQERPPDYQQCLAQAFYEQRLVEVRIKNLSVYCAGDVTIPSTMQRENNPKEPPAANIQQNIRRYLFGEFIETLEKPTASKKDLDILIGYILTELDKASIKEVLDFLETLKNLPPHEKIAELEINILDSQMNRFDDAVKLEFMEQVVELVADLIPCQDCFLRIGEYSTMFNGSPPHAKAYHLYKWLLNISDSHRLTPPVTINEFVQLLISRGLTVTYDDYKGYE